MIEQFKDDYRWLSNFWLAIIIDRQGVVQPASEYVYQTEKTLKESERIWISEARSCGEAKRRGQQVTLRPDWNEIKVSRMMYVSLLKYEQHEDLRRKLVATDGHTLIEGNCWNDWFWGAIPYNPNAQGQSGLPLWEGTDCAWAGYNWLGRILMMVRDMYK